ncbi:response regulator transcription factor [bacterium]|nr:MAG: response regulator transcription factor [bacterium]
MRLLVVEDDAEIAEGVAALLRADGHLVDVARDGREGLSRALDDRYAVVVLDVMLPAMDGWSLLAGLRRARVRTPVLMLTARDAVDDRVRGLEGGADDYLVKPFDPRELLEALARNSGRVLTRETILGSVFDADEQTDNSVSFHVASLRKKVDGGREEPLIHTVHGFGYSLRTPGSGA